MLHMYSVCIVYACFTCIHKLHLQLMLTIMHFMYVQAPPIVATATNTSYHLLLGLLYILPVLILFKEALLAWAL